MADTETLVETGSTEQVRIQLSTRDPSIEIPPTGPVLVSTNLRRYALSTLVNALRETVDTPTPFSFLIDGRFLTTSLSEYLTEHGLSSETVLDLEYVRATLPPSPQASFEHDDWISSVDVLSSTSPAAVYNTSASSVEGAERILSSSYDGIVRLWDLSGNKLADTAAIDSKLPTHVLATRFLSPNSFATAGFDSKIRLYTESASSSTPLTPSLTLLGHRHIISALSAPSQSQTFLSASSDHTTCLWSSSLDATSHGAAPANLPSHIVSSTSAKRTKIGATVGPLAVLKSHTRPVSAAIFSPQDSTVAYTASHDRQLLTWDLTQSTSISARTPAASEPLTAAAALPQYQGVVVTGTGNGNVLVVDVRESARRSAIARGRGHKYGITSIDVEPASQSGSKGSAGNGFITAARGGSELFTWDLRNTSAALVDGSQAEGGQILKPVFKLARQRKKEGSEEERREGWAVLGVRWDARVGIVSCGSDARVQVDR